MRTTTIARRWLWASVLPSLMMMLVLLVSPGVAQVAGVPASLQAELLAKLASYDRSFPSRAGDEARVMILVKSGSSKSELSAAEINSALTRLDDIGGLPHEEIMVSLTDASQLAARVRTERVAIVYCAAEIDHATIAALASAFSGVGVLTVGSTPGYVTAGMVMCFELDSGRPRIVLNLEQARKQQVDFSSSVLRLMRIVR